MKQFVLIAFLCLTTAGLSAQSVPQLVNYQGRLTDESGAPLPNGIYRLGFRIFPNATTTLAEALVWGSDYDVTVTGGAFNVLLGANGGTPTPGAAVNNLAFAFGEANRYLELRIIRNAAGNTVNQTMLPRQQLLSVPFAIQAKTAKKLNSLITSNEIASASISFDRMSPRPVGQSVPGGVVISQTVGQHITAVEGFVPNLSVEVASTGRPVILQLIGGNETASRISLRKPTGDGVNLLIALFRNGEEIARQSLSSDLSALGAYSVPSSAFRFIDLSPPVDRLRNTYSIFVRLQGNSAQAEIYNVKLVAYDL